MRVLIGLDHKLAIIPRYSDDVTGGQKMERLPIFAVIFWLCFSFGPAAQTAQNEARVGVLAYRGSDLLQDN